MTGSFYDKVDIIVLTRHIYEELGSKINKELWHRVSKITTQYETFTHVNFFTNRETNAK